MSMHTQLIGAHVSGAEGLHNSFAHATKLQANTLQLFTKSNRQWASKPLTKTDIELFKKAKKESGITTVVAHAAYLINLVSEKEEVYEKSVHALIDELTRCNQLEIPYLVLHPGSRKEPTQEVIKRMSSAIHYALAQQKNGACSLLFENMAGQGSALGSTFEELAQLLKQTDHPQSGICIDTAHLFAAGWKLDSAQAYTKLWKEFDETIGLKNLKLLHINDSKKESGSHTDRHEHIGKGKIPALFFELLMNDPKLAHIPKILETPKDDEQSDELNMAALKSLIK